MKSVFWGYYEVRKRQEKEKGKSFTHEQLAFDLGIGSSTLSCIKNGSRVLSFSQADLIERNTDGALKADDILEESIHWHKKWLERKQKFGKKTVD